MTNTRGSPHRLGRGGFTLIEVLVAMVLVSIAMLGLGPVTLRVAQMSREFTVVSQRTGVLAGEVSRLEVQPFDALAAGTSCQMDSTSSVPHTTCTTVADVGAETKQVTVIVTPLDGTAADTSVLERSKGASSNPLDTP